MSVYRRIVGSEASGSTARSKETQRRFLWQETGNDLIRLFLDLVHPRNNNFILFWQYCKYIKTYFHELQVEYFIYSISPYWLYSTWWRLQLLTVGPRWQPSTWISTKRFALPSFSVACLPFLDTSQNSLHSCLSRVAGEYPHRTVVPQRLPMPPKWTTYTGSKPGRAGSRDETRARQRVSLNSTSSTLLLHAGKRLSLTIWYFQCKALLCSHPSSWYQRRHPPVRLGWAELRFVPLHPRGETSQRRALQRRQHLLPVSGVTAGTHTRRVSGSPSWLMTGVSQQRLPSLRTVPVHEGPHREHLYRRALQSVCIGDQHDATTLETSTSAQWYAPSHQLLPHPPPDSTQLAS